MKCPHCGNELELTVAPLGGVVEGSAKDGTQFATGRAMVDIKHIAPCQDFLKDPVGSVLSG
jgi:hypothetical protein